MNAQQIFEGLRSLRSVADDVLDSLGDKVDEVLDKFEDFVDAWEQNFEDVKAEQAGTREPTRADKVMAVYEYLQKNYSVSSPLWNPSHPQNGEIDDDTVEYAYQRWVKGNYDF